MARHMTEPGEDVLGWLRRRTARLTSSADAREVASLRDRPPRDRALAADEGSTSTSSFGIWTSRWPICRRVGFYALSRLAARARHGRALGPGCRRAPRRLLALPAPSMIGRWNRLPASGTVAIRGSRLGVAARVPARRAASADRRATTSNASSRSTVGAGRRRQRLVRGHSRMLGPVDAQRVARSRRAPDDDPLAAMLSRRQARARRRHAPLLRPDVDGPLARGARPVPRSPGRRALRGDPERLKVIGAWTTKYCFKRGRTWACPRSHHRQAQDRLLQRRRRDWFRGRYDGRSATTCSILARRTPSFSTPRDRTCL